MYFRRYNQKKRRSADDRRLGGNPGWAPITSLLMLSPLPHHLVSDAYTTLLGAYYSVKPFRAWHNPHREYRGKQQNEFD